MFSTADTIVALATAASRAGIGVVRVSGPRAHEVARAILTVPHDLQPRYATLTHVQAAGHGNPPAGFGGGSRGSGDDSPAPAGTKPPAGVSGDAPASVLPIDEVVATFFPGPRSYTAEDVVEISAHGSLALLREIVEAAIGAGARLAGPGEFTFRAFLNGRVDLVQAEAVGDLIDAVTPLQARAAFDQLEGTLTRAIAALDQDLFDLAARLEASIDFPDEGYHFVAPGEASEILRRVCDGVDGLLTTSARGRVIREGQQIAILGKPNVGKSSLFNKLVGTDRAIVGTRPGTTRDMLSETIDFEGIRLGLVDTAGIGVSSDDVEQEGVWRARRAAEIADLVVLVIDRSRPLEEIDLALLEETAGAARVVAVNKSDLAPAWNIDDEDGPFRRGSGVLSSQQRTTEGGKPTSPVVLSLKTGAGVDELRAAMREALHMAEPLREAAMVTNVRHEALLRQVRDALWRAIENLAEAGEWASEELVLADLGDARRAFEEVTGRRTTEDVLARIFERFCVGK